MSRPNLLMLPGLNNTAAVFDGVLQALDPQIEANAIDLPAIDTVEALADWVLADLARPSFICGFSFGGYVALAMLERGSELFEGLALVCSLPFADSEAAGTSRLAAIEMAQEGKYEEMVKSNAAKAFHPDNLGNDELMKKRAAMVADYSAVRFVAHSKAAMIRPDRTQIFVDYPGPKLMLAGDKDSLTPAASMRELVGSEHMEVISSAGHLLPMEQPEAMAGRLSQWILAEVP